MRNPLSAATLAPLVRLVDDDAGFRESQSALLSAMGRQVRCWPDAESFLAEDDLERPGCIVLDMRMPGMTGLDLQRRLSAVRFAPPVIFLTGHGDVDTAVHAMKYGAADFLEKRGDPMRLAAAVERACRHSVEAARAFVDQRAREVLHASLTPRERDVLALAAKGLSNKEAAAALGIGPETVKMHKAGVYGKLGLSSALEAYRWLEALGKGRAAGRSGFGENPS